MEQAEEEDSSSSKKKKEKKIRYRLYRREMRFTNPETAALDVRLAGPACLFVFVSYRINAFYLGKAQANIY